MGIVYLQYYYICSVICFLKGIVAQYRAKNSYRMEPWCCAHGHWKNKCFFENCMGVVLVAVISRIDGRVLNFLCARNCAFEGETSSDPSRFRGTLQRHNWTVSS